MEATKVAAHTPGNRFRDHTMRQQYDAAVRAFETKHRDLFVNGTRRTVGGYGSSFASAFWHGYDGDTKGVACMSDKASRSTLAYAYYRAGQDCAAIAKAQP